MARIGEGWCFFANAVSYIAVIVGLLLMKLGPIRLVSREATAIEHIAEGFRFVRHTAPICASCFCRPRQLGGDALHRVDADICRECCTGRARPRRADGRHRNRRFLGALMLAMRHGVQGSGRWIAISARFRVEPHSVFIFAIARAFVLLLLPVGLRDDADGLLQHTDSGHGAGPLRGRAMAVYSMMFMGMAPIGALLAGALADRIGAPWTVAIGGIGAIGGGIIFWTAVAKAAIGRAAVACGARLGWRTRLSRQECPSANPSTYV